MEIEKDLVIGIDASTTGCKATVWSRQGEQIALGRCKINQLNPKPDSHEQSALDWWQALRKAISLAIANIGCPKWKWGTIFEGAEQPFSRHAEIHLSWLLHLHG